MESGLYIQSQKVRAIWYRLSKDATLVFQEQQQQTVVDAEEDNNCTSSYHQQLLFSEIQRLMKEFKTHRCALDFDKGFINVILKENNTGAA